MPTPKNLWDKISNLKEDSINVDNINYYSDLLGESEIDDWPLDKTKHAFYLVQALLNARGELVKSSEEAISDYLSQIEDLQNQQKDLENENATLQKAVSGSSSSINLVQERRNWELERERLEHEVDSYKAKVDELSREKMENEGTKGDLEKQLKNQQDDNRRMAERFEFMQTRIQEKSLGSTKISEDQNFRKEILKEANSEIEVATSDFFHMKQALQESDRLLAEKSSEIDQMRIQLGSFNRDTADPQANDEIMKLVDEKVNEWKQVLAEKDEEIVRLYQENRKLRQEIGSLSFDSNKLSTKALISTLKDRENTIKEMKAKLVEATKELEESEKIVRDLKTIEEEVDQGGKQLSKAEKQKLQMIELKRQLVEKDKLIEDLDKRHRESQAEAILEAQKRGEIEDQLTKYERGEFGLEEALIELRACRNELAGRENQLEEICRVASRLESELDEVNLENEHLRNRLGIAADEAIDLDAVRRRKKAHEEEEKATNLVLQKEIESLEEERLNLKRKVRDLARQIGHEAGLSNNYAEPRIASTIFSNSVRAPTENWTTDKEDLVTAVPKTWQARIKELTLQKQKCETKLDDCVETNRLLQQGMRELKEEKSSPSFEKLLAVMDSRSLLLNEEDSVYMKARIDYLEGANRELRDQLQTALDKRARAQMEVEANSEQLRILKQRFASLEVDDVNFVGSQQTGEIPLPLGLSDSSSKTLAALEEHLCSVMLECEEKDKALTQHTEIMDELRRKYSMLRHRQALLYDEFRAEKESFEEEKQNLQTTVKRLKEKVTVLTVFKEEHERLWNSLDQGR
ncbi:hypothetical protein Ciccas_006682 [Cichlidogyrus casuarinus]|uniref:Uncharacterized protein n=1 Tax=Cichlidogyrus casuarinus TaxID=1844966 RepID=A0ABD2Q524_9PLAT